MNNNTQAVASFRVELTANELIEIRHILNHGLQKHEADSAKAERQGRENDMHFHDDECERFIDLGIPFYETQVEVNDWSGAGWETHTQRELRLQREQQNKTA